MAAFRVLIAIAVLLAGFSGVVSAQSDDEFEIFGLVNRERTKSRLGALEWDGDLAKVARSYSRQMAREGFFDHYDPKGKTVIDRAAKVDRWSKIGENLFMCSGMDNFTSFSVRGWMRSTTHRRNIMDRGWTATGIGIARSRDDRIYVTQVFIRR